MAVSHYQFEVIHPFYDGSGRTGCILNVLSLIECGLLTLPILYLSRFIVHNKKDYYRLLNQVTKDQNWEDWLLFMLKGVEQTAIWTSDKITGINERIQEARRLRIIEFTLTHIELQAVNAAAISYVVSCS